MFSFLKNHPFAVEAFFESSVVITFAIPKVQLERLIPESLMLDVLKEQWGFVAVAMVQTRKLRPKGFPRFTGNDFFLVGYRIFVRYTNSAGKKLRGLYILKSETDKKRMELLGNVFTHYHYTTIDITQSGTGSVKKIGSRKSNFTITIDTKDTEPGLPEHSPFTDWKEARRFAGPLPFTFTYDPVAREVLTIEGVREQWHPRPILVLDHSFTFFESLGIENPVLASAFIVENIPYQWKKGKKELWKR